jgi:hypothetical protein
MKKDSDVPDRSDQKREGFVPSGRRGWLKVGGKRRTTEVQPVTPAWARTLRNQSAEGEAGERAVILGQDWYHHLKRLEAKRRAEDDQKKESEASRKENE